MSAHAVRLSRLFTPEYVKRINAQIVHPAPSVLVKPNELESSVSRPLQLSFYEPERPPAYFAATLSYGIIKGHPFMDGNKRTANEYLRAMGIPGLADAGKVGAAYESVENIAQRHMDVAAGKLGIEGLAGGQGPDGDSS
ncbi:hypothetical protein CC1G_11123 [Coprinopsis cinerea okayama7|uniref:Fido domain-containing protein n=1 Tax=Coprinopsis cinerea (strain Okayama-7 / 130 / ATCC MYA-4618 / FGSC 9003) TaxID=240176 RepID=A8N4Q8_COPC7|nr:hypothetical protein CC1G_11123 [Coprinopsis cinerea okayama7\|eukprot:XP_001829853.1 hypothetical protein CC1G_11123 [Coprinopsis cinerea okayama7\